MASKTPVISGLTRTQHNLRNLLLVVRKARVEGSVMSEDGLEILESILFTMAFEVQAALDDAHDQEALYSAAVRSLSQERTVQTPIGRYVIYPGNYRPLPANDVRSAS